MRQPPLLECDLDSFWQRQDYTGKFKSFLSHIIDKHDDLDDPLYNKCAHDELTPRKWLLPGLLVKTFLLIAAMN